MRDWFSGGCGPQANRVRGAAPRGASWSFCRSRTLCAMVFRRRWSASNRARGAAPTGQAGLFVGATPCARWFSGVVVCRQIAHGVLLPQGQAGFFVGAAPFARLVFRRLWSAGKSRTGCCSHRASWSFVGAAPCARWFSGAVVCRQIAHGVLLPQGKLVFCGSRTLRAMVFKGPCSAGKSRTGCCSHRVAAPTGGAVPTGSCSVDEPSYVGVTAIFRPAAFNTAVNVLMVGLPRADRVL